MMIDSRIKYLVLKTTSKKDLFRSIGSIVASSNSLYALQSLNLYPLPNTLKYYFLGCNFNFDWNFGVNASLTPSIEILSI